MKYFIILFAILMIFVSVSPSVKASQRSYPVVFRPTSSAATTPNIRLCIMKQGLSQDQETSGGTIQSIVCDTRPGYNVTKYLSTTLTNVILLNICVDQDTKYNNDGSLTNYTLIKSGTCWSEAVR